MRFRLSRGGQTIDLSREKKLGEGGEARVFSIAALGLAAKVFHRVTPERRRKLEAMVANPPADPTSAQGHVSIAWPCDLLLDPGGHFRGYAMPLVQGMERLVGFYVPRLRRQQRPLFNYAYLVTAALNVATALRALHQRGYVVGDLNESNILLADTALATIVDTDSFQVRDAAGKIHRCLVGTPGFTPPEMQGRVFGAVDREPEHDRFGLAVVLFQLLMEGTHPFDGIYTQEGEPPELEQRIAQGHFPHGAAPRCPIRPKPVAPPFALLEPALQRLFVQCFRDGHARPAARPEADTWRDALVRAREVLRTCRSNEEHRYWGHVGCPWCERAQLLRGVDPFPSRQAVREGRHRQRSTGAPTPVRPASVPLRRPVPSGPALRMPLPVRPRVRTTPSSGWAAAGAAAGRGWVRWRQRLRTGNLWAWGAVVVVIVLAWNLRPPRGQADAARFAFLDLPTAGRLYRVGEGMNMLWIAPGTFRMGDTAGTGSAHERPVHEVRLSSGFWLGESEVTQAQWQAVMGSNPSRFRGDDRPVENVSWNEADAFCRLLTARARAAGRLPTGIEYRLPTEAQWEYACRAQPALNPAGELDAVAWYEANSNYGTSVVKNKRPNAWGLRDMRGNVWEWCADLYAPYSAEAQLDPTGPRTGTDRVFRGGSWKSGGRDCRFENRSATGPEIRGPDLGFRLSAVQTAGIAVISGTASDPKGPRKITPQD